jgi:SAM-dependent methyltransferase
MNPVHDKTEADIAAEWDRIALKRAHQIESGADLSFTNVLLPTVVSLATGCDSTAVVDVGCGAGFLSAQIASQASKIVGIDISQKNIDYARRRWSAISNATFVAISVEAYAEASDTPRFTLALSNMTLMTVLDLDRVIKSIATLLVPGGHLVATLTHPCFWPLYWGYADKKWFKYSDEIAIESEFRISLDPTPGFTTTHIHRPLERYLASLSRSGFLIEELREPFPPSEIERQYPVPWRFPRFLSLRATRK